MERLELIQLGVDLGDQRMISPDAKMDLPSVVPVWLVGPGYARDILGKFVNARVEGSAVVGETDIYPTFLNRNLYIIGADTTIEQVADYKHGLWVLKHFGLRAVCIMPIQEA